MATGPIPGTAHLLTPQLGRVQSLLEVPVYLTEGFVEQINDPLYALSDDGVCVLQSVLLTSLHTDELAAPGDECIQLKGLRGFGRLWAQIADLTEVGDYPCIQPVCLGQLTLEACEVPDMSWVQDGSRNPLIAQGCRQSPLVAPLASIAAKVGSKATKRVARSLIPSWS